MPNMRTTISDFQDLVQKSLDLREVLSIETKVALVKATAMIWNDIDHTFGDDIDPELRERLALHASPENTDIIVAAIRAGL